MPKSPAPWNLCQATANIFNVSPLGHGRSCSAVFIQAGTVGYTGSFSFSVSPELSLECGLAFLGTSLSLSLPAFGVVEILILAVGVYKAPHILISLY